MDPGAQQKTMLKNIPQTIENVQKMIPKLVPENELIFGVAPPGAPLVAQTAKMGPHRSQSAPNDRKINKNDTKEPQDCEKELQKSSLFGAWPGGLREALTIIFNH